MKYFDSEILLKPVTTEKSSMALGERVYVFKVSLDSNKIQIRNDVEKLFSVKVDNVNTLTVKPKKRVRGRIVGYTKIWKKAMVKLVSGEIDLSKYNPVVKEKATVNNKAKKGGDS